MFWLLKVAKLMNMHKLGFGLFSKIDWLKLFYP